MLKSLDNLNVAEASKKLKDLKINPNLAVEILETANGMNLLRGSADEVADGIRKTAAEATKSTATMGTAFKGLGTTLKSFITSPTGILTAAIAVGALAVALEDAFTVDYGEANDAFRDSVATYKNSVSDLESLNSELDTTQTRISELQSLNKAGTITIAEQGELELLQSQNDELERKISLQEKLVEVEKNSAINDAKTAIEKADHSVAQSVRAGDSKGEKNYKGLVGKVTDAEAVHEDIELIGEYNDKVSELENKVLEAKKKVNAEKASGDELGAWLEGLNLKAAEEELKHYQDSIITLESDMASRSSNMAEQLEILKLDPSANAKAIRELENAIDIATNFDIKSPIQKQLSQIETAFNGSLSTDTIKDQILELMKSGMSATDALHSLGLTLSDLGIKGKGKGKVFDNYFDDLKKSAEEAGNAINSIDGSVSGVKTALESENQDANWNSMSDALSQASELYKSGKVGVDDFKAAAQFMTKSVINPDGNGFKYDADAYVKAWEDAQGKVKRYFDKDNPFDSINNFANDLVSNGLAEKVGDEFNWAESFDNSAQAADALGISIDAVETLMHNLESYGAEFDGVKFSGEQLSEYKSSLEGIKTIYDELEEGEEKDRLGKVLELANEDDFENHLENLTDDKVIEIEFEYNLAQIEHEIQQLQKAANEGDETALTALNVKKSDKRDLLEEDNKYSGGISEEYDNASTSIQQLQAQMKSANADQRLAIKEQISSIYDAQNAMQEAFASSGISWDEFLKTDQYSEAIANIANTSDEAKQAIADLLGIKVEDLEIGVDADTSKAESKIDGVLSNNGNTIIMEIDATTEQIQSQINNLQEGQTILFTAEVEGEPKGIEAVKNQDGTITYTTIVDDKTVEVDLHKDGTVTYKKDGQEAPDPQNAGVTYHKEGQDAPSAETASNYYTYGGQDAPQNRTATVYYSAVTSAIPSALSAGYAVVNKTVGGFNGTAHVHGTANASGNWAVKKSEPALVGELGKETVIRNGKFFTVGDNGAEIANIRAGDIIFNHKQTEELFKYGYVTSGGGRAKIVGSAFAEGTAYANGWRIPSGGSGSKSSGNKSSGTKSSGSSNNASSSSNSSDASKEFSEKFDHIEIWIDRMERALNRLTDSIETYSHNLEKQNSIVDQSISSIRGNLGTLQQAYNRYMQEANASGLEENWKNVVKNGEIQISTITDEDLKKRIEEYQKYYEKALDVENKIADLQKQLVELAVEKLNNIESYYENRENYNANFGYETNIDELNTALGKYTKELENQVNSGTITKYSNEWYKAMESVSDYMDKIFEAVIARIESVITNIENATKTFNNIIDLKEARGQDPTREDYTKIIENNNSQIEELYKKREKYLASMAVYDVNSDKYKELAADIASCDDELYDLLTNNEKLKDSIFEAEVTKPLEKLSNQYNNLIDEVDSLRGLMNDDAFVDPKGMLTPDGVANIALIAQGMSASKKMTADYTAALKKLDEALKNNLISQTEYDEQQEKILSTIRDSVETTEDYRNELIDLYKTQLETENDALQKTIDKRKEALQSKKEYYDYDKKVKEQSKEVNVLLAQAIALEGVENASAKARLKQIQDQLKTAQNELDETKLDHKYEIQVKGLDTMSEDLDDSLQKILEEITYNANKQEEIVQNTLNKVVGMYGDAYGKISDLIHNTGFVQGDKASENTEKLGTEGGANNIVSGATTPQPNVKPSNTVENMDVSGTPADNTHNQKVEAEISKPIDITNRPVAELKLTASSLSIQEGGSGKIGATVRPTDAANKTLAWVSSNTDVATVSSDGSVKAVKPGSATITCSTTDGSGISQTCNVTVNKKPDPPKPKPSGGGDGVARVGDVVTLNAGQRYFYDSWGQTPAGNLYAGVPNGVVIDGYSGSEYGGAARFHGGYGVHIKSADGKYSDLGWVSLSQISGYAKGTTGVKKTELARINEVGDELLTRQVSIGGKDYSILTKGTGVIPANITRNLMDFGINPQRTLMNTLAAMPNSNNKSVSVTYGNLINIEGNATTDTVDRLENMMPKLVDRVTDGVTKKIMREYEKLT